MSVLDRAALEGSPLADLHAIASELSIDGYRRLRRADLIEAILTKQSGREESDDGAETDREEPEPAGTSELMDVVADELRVHGGDQPRRRRGRRGGRGRGGAREDSGERQAEAPSEEPAQKRADADQAETADRGEATEEEREATADRGEATEEERESTAEEREATAEKRESTAEEREATAERGDASEEEREATAEKRGASEQEREVSAEKPEPDGDRRERTDDTRGERPPEEPHVEGVVELLPNGSGFLRVDPPEPSDEDVYISAAQVKRCELVSGDRISGPRRVPRRSERFASLVRIDTINDRPAEEVADSARFEDLPAAFPAERFQLASDDSTIKAIDGLTPLGKGSRATIVGGPRAGKSETLRRLAAVLAGDQGLQLSLVLAGVRPEELSEWPIEPVAAISLAASADAQGQTVERVVDQGRRLAARGADAVVLIDTLDGVDPHVARKQLAAARKLVEGGSLTVIATAREPLGGETTVIALDPLLTASGRFPALDPIASGTIRPELLVGEAGAETITRARAEAIEGKATGDRLTRYQ